MPLARRLDTSPVSFFPACFHKVMLCSDTLGCMISYHRLYHPGGYGGGSYGGGSYGGGYEGGRADAPGVAGTSYKVPRGARCRPCHKSTALLETFFREIEAHSYFKCVICKCTSGDVCCRHHGKQGDAFTTKKTVLRFCWPGIICNFFRVLQMFSCAGSDQLIVRQGNLWMQNVRNVLFCQIPAVQE